MKNDELIQEALDFFNLDSDFEETELKRNFHILALKFHPDRGEYTSEVLFVQLIKYKEILDKHLESKKNLTSQEKSKTLGSKKEYEIYKNAKNMESSAILDYFKSRDGNPLQLLEKNNPELVVLRKKLEKSKELYLKIIHDFPTSIWLHDAKESIERIDVWLK